MIHTTCPHCGGGTAVAHNADTCQCTFCHHVFDTPRYLVSSASPSETAGMIALLVLLVLFTTITELMK